MADGQFHVSVVNQDQLLPPGAFGLTNRPGELLHLVIDAPGAAPESTSRAGEPRYRLLCSRGKAVSDMCGLCGVLGTEDHWTDASARPEAFGGRAPRTRRRERFERITLANRILRHYRLTLGDFQGRSYVLRSATGRQELVPSLVGMWSAAEKLAGRPCDPLDPELIAALQDQPE